MKRILILPVPGHCDELARRIADCARAMREEVEVALRGNSHEIVCIDELQVTSKQGKRKAQWKREQNRYRRG